MDVADFIESREEFLSNLRNGYTVWQITYSRLLHDLNKVDEFVDEEEGNTATAAEEDIEISLTVLDSDMDDFENTIDELKDIVEKTEDGMEQSLDDVDLEVKDCVIAVEDMKETAETTGIILSDEITSFSSIIAELMEKYEDQM